MKKSYAFAIILLIGAGIWFSPRPEAINPAGWHIFAIFVATITGLILEPLPIGAMSLIALSLATITKSISIDEALVSYSKPTIWIIVFAFFISRAIIKTQLGTRIAYIFVGLFGKKSLGLSYSLTFSEALLAPAIPSVTARTGGIIFPIVNSLSQALGSKPNHSSSNKLGSFLILVSFHISVITSAMFITAMTANPMIQRFALDNFNVRIEWIDWASASIVPGLISLIVIPLIIYILAPPEIKDIPNAYELARAKLKEMGKMTHSAWIMLGVFALLLVLWSLGSKFLKIPAETTALLAICILLATHVLTFEELLAEHNAWSSLIWFGALLTLAEQLKNQGVISYFSQLISTSIQSIGLEWYYAFLVLALFYFFAHYIFASCIAHVGAMFTAFVAVAILLGTPPLLAIFLLAFYSSLFGGLTHYGIGSAPVLFGSGYVSLKRWWTVGLVVSIANLLIWTVIGSWWWHFLGLWHF